MSDLVGFEKVDRLPILVTTMGETKLLHIPKIATRTGQAIASAVNNAIRDWKVEHLVRAICFDTTSSNIYRMSGACALIEQL